MGRERLRGLDGVRGLAVALVAYRHLDPASTVLGGMTGVTLFFVLSGYLITRLLAEEVAVTGGVDFAAFWWRRAARLLPALGVLLAVFGIVWTLAGRAAQWWLSSLIAATYTSDLLLSIGMVSGGSMLGLAHTWTLGVEELFYLLWPLLLIGLLRKRNPWRWCALLMLVAICWRLHLGAQHVSTVAQWARIYFAPDANAFALLAGCALALAPRWQPSRGLVALSLVGLIAVSVVPVSSFSTYVLTGVAIPILAAALGVIIVAGSASSALLSHPAMEHLGLISYSFYLWHEPLSVLAVHLGVHGALLGLVPAALAYGFAEASRRWVEVPVLTWARSRNGQIDRGKNSGHHAGAGQGVSALQIEMSRNQADA